ncbi:hypothetical protein QJS04_geneDACA001450 [Acorus gramineus]|uniref:Trafficking protein particle complex subunit 11 n=1 Tax=Acorus gramineus TaxID=55184 RepID=A0AAV9A4N9_ACOGR|nr:hypothetical protein QJS04_geneDACA001450 [Acorus gramineus]
MEDYGEDLQTPPVTLVSLVGYPELHQPISSFLHSENPPINTLALPDFSKAAIFARKQQEQQEAAPAPGILRRDWLSKHRTRVPAVVAAIFGADRLSGDPAQWLQVCTDLENLKAVIRGRNTKLVIVLVQTSIKDDVGEDVLIALRKRAEIDSKYLVMFFPSDTTELRHSLNRLAGIFAELSNIYYREEGRRIKARIEKKSFSSVELNIRYCFKVAVYAEFRRDWAEALRFYEDGYHALREMVGITTRLPPIQRLVEIKAVVEQFHFKISTLLLHGGKVVEAITWFRKHIASYQRLVGAPEVTFLHWEWLSRQYLVFAELLETSAATIPSAASVVFGTTDNPLTEWEFQPAHYYQLSAQYLTKKKHCLHLSLSKPKAAESLNQNESVESAAPSVYVGQFAHLIDQGEMFGTLPLTDVEYASYALSEGKRFQDSYEIIALLRKSFESFNTTKAQRITSYCSNRMAKEYYNMEDFSNAKQIFSCAVSLYRQEGWVTLLWESLGYLRECSRKLSLWKDFVEYSLEMAALPIVSKPGADFSVQKSEYGPSGPACFSQRETIQEEVFKILRGEQTFGSTPDLMEDQPLCIDVDLVSPMRTVFLASAAFHDQSVKPGASTLLTLSLLSQLPLPVDVDQLEIQFNQPLCNFTITSARRVEDPTGVLQGTRVETGPVLKLESNKWFRLSYEIKSEQSGKLECVSVTAKLGHRFIIHCQIESPASMEDLPLWKFEDRFETFPTKEPSLSFYGQKVIQVEEPDPEVDMILSASGPALVGEIFTVTVTVTSRGHAIHSGELKINLVDSRGGLISPREMEPSSSDSHHVELLDIVGLPDENDLQGGESIRKVQQSFGLVSLPPLRVGYSWSCNLEIKWQRPKPIMLYVSLGYSPNATEGNMQKIHVHKSLQIEGKAAVSISHRFMMPFRREPLLLSQIRPTSNPNQLTSIPLNETSILLVSAKNCTEVPLRLISMSIEMDGEDVEHMCTVTCNNGSSPDLSLLVPGEEFKQVFSVTPSINSTKLGIGTVFLKWVRDSKLDQSPDPAVISKYRLPDVNVEKPPIVAVLECPPHAIIGVPFTFDVRVRNQTNLLQEIKFSLADSQSFVLSGPHNDSVFILPDSEHFIGYKLVPLASGPQQLPRITITSVRYSAGVCPSISASTVFVFPSEPLFGTEVDQKQNTRTIEA